MIFQIVKWYTIDSANLSELEHAVGIPGSYGQVLTYLEMDKLVYKSATHPNERQGGFYSICCMSWFIAHEGRVIQRWTLVPDSIAMASRPDGITSVPSCMSSSKGTFLFIRGICIVSMYPRIDFRWTSSPIILPMFPCVPLTCYMWFSS